MRSLKLSVTKPSAPAQGSRQAAAAGADSPAERAERQFGAPAHLVLVSDEGPAVSFMGWTLGTATAEMSEQDTGGLRIVVVEVMFSEEGEYVICERIETRQGGGTRELGAIVTKFPAPRDVHRYCEQATLDPQADAARAAAVDHSARLWPWLKRPGRHGTGESIVPPFAL
jgi:hypothetical protein